MLAKFRRLGCAGHVVDRKYAKFWRRRLLENVNLQERGGNVRVAI
jgi:hypothetical protein